MNRKQRRSLSKQAGSKNAENISQQMTLFGKLPEKCSACSEPFDKKDKDMVNKWNVVVKQDVVRLFCPNCIEKTQEIIRNECE